MAHIWVGNDDVLAVSKEIAEGRGDRIIRLLWQGESPSLSYVDPLLRLAEERKPAVILLPSRGEMNDLASYLAQAMNCPCLSGCIKVKYVKEEDCLEVERLIYGGAAVQVIKNRTWPVIVTLIGGEKTEPEGDIEVREISPICRAELQVVERRKKDTTGRSLTEARVVVSVGRGLNKKEDLRLVRELATALGGEIGCTRPLAAELNWLPESACIGLSGAQISPELYMALGISGQIQHVVGMRGARIVVAVNRDEKAPIFGVADFGIVGDLYHFIPLFLDALGGKK